ncbi:ubiquitin specific peptidase 33 [Phyllostomus discolor]|uniref:Ubiquitin specific peptidase 33 n=1 Tax=Phyllostomus discolor TaxID=89673 RepID=A0A834AGZ1_9CHIR|nr:ubiquitin specific peptidase 33 [Phyllostomus discolor]
MTCLHHRSFHQTKVLIHVYQQALPNQAICGQAWLPHRKKS